MTQLRFACLIATVLGVLAACGDDAAKDGLSGFQNQTDRGRPRLPDGSQPDAGATDTGLDVTPNADTGAPDTGALDTGPVDTGDDLTDAGDLSEGDPDTGPDLPEENPLEPGLLGYIGSACETAADCPFDGAVCLEAGEGYPLGMCTTGCDRLCPDQDGFPTTFCADSDTAGAACHSRCDFTIYPSGGCREGYSCIQASRSGEPETVRQTCLPGAGSECLQWLVDHDVAFEPTTYNPRSPEGRPDLTCAIEDPIRLHSPLDGIELRYYYDDPGEFRTLLMSCHLARALHEATDILHDYQIVEILHIGTTVCRTTSFGSLSQHALGLAIDIGGFFDDNANYYGVEDHWEHDTNNPISAAARLLYDVAYTWFEDWIFDTILTPNYNSAHDNHFHVDLTPGAHFIGVLGPDAGARIGVNPGAE